MVLSKRACRLALLFAILVIGGCSWLPSGLQSEPDAAALVTSQVDTFFVAGNLQEPSLFETVLAPEVSVEGNVAGFGLQGGSVQREAFIQALLEADIALFEPDSRDASNQQGAFIPAMLETGIPLFDAMESFMDERTVTITGNQAVVAGKFHYEFELLPGMDPLTISGTIVFELESFQDTWMITGISLDWHVDLPDLQPDPDPNPDPDPDPTPNPDPDPKPDPDPDPQPDVTIETGWIRADSSNFRTPYYVLKSAQPGPTLMVVGGVHGNEIAGYQAAERLVTEFAPDRGTVVVIPRANARAVSLNTRGAPDLTDLNRRFPTGSSPIGLTANAIWDIVVKYEPDWFLDLHEGYDFHIINKNSVGQSVIVYPTGNSTSVARSLVNYLNGMPAITRNGSKRFSYLQYPVSGSLARKVGADLRIPAAIIETAWPDPLARRVGFQLQAVQFVAERMGMKLVDQTGLKIEKRAI